MREKEGFDILHNNVPRIDRSEAHHAGERSNGLSASGPN
jgi:hypothetical protein